MSNPDRRQFMKQSSATVAGVSAAAGFCAVNTDNANANADNIVLKGRVFKSLKMGMVKLQGTMVDKMKQLQDLGFDGLELNSPGGVNKDEARQASEKTGFPIQGVVDSRHWGVRFTDPKPEVREKAKQDLETAIKDSYRVGGNAVLIVPGHGNDGPIDVIIKRAHEQISATLPLAAKYGQHILIENVWNRMFYDHDGKTGQTADALRDFIDSFNSPWIGSYFDIGNHQKYADPASWIRTLGKRIVKLDVKGYHRGNGKWTKIGEGDIDWLDVRRALKEINFTGWATAEVSGGGTEHLRGVSQRMDKTILGL